MVYFDIIDIISSFLGCDLTRKKIMCLSKSILYHYTSDFHGAFGGNIKELNRMKKFIGKLLGKNEGKYYENIWTIEIKVFLREGDLTYGYHIDTDFENWLMDDKISPNTIKILGSDNVSTFEVENPWNITEHFDIYFNKKSDAVLPTTLGDFIKEKAKNKRLNIKTFTAGILSTNNANIRLKKLELTSINLTTWMEKYLTINGSIECDTLVLRYGVKNFPAISLFNITVKRMLVLDMSNVKSVEINKQVIQGIKDIKIIKIKELPLDKSLEFLNQFKELERVTISNKKSQKSDFTELVTFQCRELYFSCKTILKNEIIFLKNLKNLKILRISAKKFKKNTNLYESLKNIDDVTIDSDVDEDTLEWIIRIFGNSKCLTINSKTKISKEFVKLSKFIGKNVVLNIPII